MRRYPHVILGVLAIALAVVATFGLETSEADGTARSFPSRGAIALTFDDGPDPRYTPAVLDVLAAHGARATFFVLGENAERHPELIERMLAEGHEIAHHTHSHPHVDTLSEEQLAVEMDRCLEVLRVYGVEPSWYRPPRAARTPAQDTLASERGMRVAMWARCLERSHFTDARVMASTVAAETRHGDIVLAHDGLLDRTMTVEALPLYLETLGARGIEVVTLTELELRGSR